MGKTLHYTPPPTPPISPEERKQLLALSEQNKESIDFSDIPPASEDEWKRAVRGRFYRPSKSR